MAGKKVKVKKDFSTSSSKPIECETFEDLKTEGRKALGISKDELHQMLHKNKKLEKSQFEKVKLEDVVIFRTVSGQMVEELTAQFEGLETGEAVRNALIEKGKLMDSGFVREALLMAADTMKGNAAADNDTEDKDWFKGIKGKPPKSKSAFLGKSAETRVRNYWAKAKGVINKVYNDAGGHDSDEEVEGPASKAANLKMDWMTKLRRAEFCKRYFGKDNDSHTAAPSDTDGWFSCKGHYTKEECQYGHRINPYSSYEQRKLFSTWEFDHIAELDATGTGNSWELSPLLVMEKIITHPSACGAHVVLLKIEIRVIIPRLKEMLEDDEEYDDDSWDYLYECLFGAENLRLVHPVCHDTHRHKGKVLDEDRLEPL